MSGADAAGGVALVIGATSDIGRATARRLAGEMRVVFFPRAKSLCLDEFSQPMEEIRCNAWPKDREPLEDPDTEIQFKFTAEEWENHRDRLNALTSAVYEAWESSGQEEDSS